MSTQNITAQAQIAKRKSTKSIIWGVALLLLGIVLFIFSTTISDKGSSLYMVSAVGSFAAMIVGLFKLLFGGRETIYLPTKSPVKNYTIYFESLASDVLVELIETGKFGDIQSAKRKESGPVRLDVQRSGDDCFVSLQVLQYVPYNYENVSGTYCFEADDAPQVAACVGNATK